jgi:hypothetical protein
MIDLDLSKTFDIGLVLKGVFGSVNQGCGTSHSFSFFHIAKPLILLTLKNGRRTTLTFYDS